MRPMKSARKKQNGSSMPRRHLNQRWCSNRQRQNNGSYFVGPLSSLLHGNPDSDDGEDEGDHGERKCLQSRAFCSEFLNLLLQFVDSASGCIGRKIVQQSLCLILPPIRGRRFDQLVKLQSGVVLAALHKNWTTGCVEQKTEQWAAKPRIYLGPV